MPAASKQARYTDEEEEEIKITMKRFKMTQVKPGRTILICGKRNSGKSVLIEDIMFTMRHEIDIPIAFVGTHDTASDYAKHMPSTHIHVSSVLDVSILENMLALCKALDKAYKACAVPGQPGYEQVQRNVFVFIDDMMADKAWTKDPKVNEIILNGRHMGITFIVGAQYIMDAPQAHKSQADLTFIFNDDRPAVTERLYKDMFRSYHQLFASQRDFDAKFPVITSNYQVIVLDRTTTSKNGGQIRVYKAEYNHGPFTIGSAQFWALCLRFSKTREQIREQALNEVTDVVGNIMDNIRNNAPPVSAKSRKRKAKRAPSKKAKKKKRTLTSDQISLVIANDDSDEEPVKKVKPVRVGGDELSLVDSASMNSLGSAVSSKISYRSHDSNESDKKRRRH